jgi:tartrate/fumarate subfamily iron-sulfur-dependent hydro-lyase alpha chain
MKTIPDLETHLFELIRRASTKLPADVTAALAAGQAREAAGSPAAATLATILENVELSAQAVSPICQDTGTPVFYVKHPWDYPVRPIREAALAAVRRATRESLLRPNAVDSVTGANSNDNTGDAFPAFYFEQWEEADSVRFDLLLKGGGSENQSAQYSLPHGGLKAGRDLEGVKRVILDAVVNAQGQGCAPPCSGCASAATGRPATRWPRSSTSGPWPTRAPTRCSPPWRKKSPRRPIPSAWVPWVSAAPPPCWPPRSLKRTACQPASTSPSATCAGPLARPA